MACRRRAKQHGAPGNPPASLPVRTASASLCLLATSWQLQTTTTTAAAAAGPRAGTRAAGRQEVDHEPVRDLLPGAAAVPADRPA